jgi:xylulokinase
MLLGIDIGSSSVKAAVLNNGRISGVLARAPFRSHFQGVRAEVDPTSVLKAVAAAIAQVGPPAKKVDAIGLSIMSPSWVAMDKSGKPLTPIITHQDRRSVEIAAEIERRVGKDRHLQLAGNRPFPGGISSTTFAWFREHEPALMRRADLVGHLNTFLHRQITGQRVVDPSNASFMGLYRTVDLSGWSDELCDAVGLSSSLLPEVLDADRVGGRVTPAAARRFGLFQGTPMLVGLVDTGAAMLLAGARPGQFVNVVGTTDVLIVCTDRPRPHERLLTRALGIGRLWTSVATLASAGSSLNWMKDQFFADLTAPAFFQRVAKLARSPLKTGARFEPYLAGERTSLEQRQGAFTGLTLATTREHMLSAVIESLAAASAARLPLLRQQAPRARHDVIMSGGAVDGLARLLHRDWPGKWRFKTEQEATLRGLARLRVIGPK